MSLKDEIEKLIQQEQRKIEERELKDAEFQEKQRQHFRPLCTLLEEIVASVDIEHIESRIYDDSATIEVGKKKDNYFSAEVRWKVEPNCELTLSAEKGESRLRDLPGFRVKETRNFDTSISEHNLVFSTEQETAEYVIKQIAEKMAYYRHLKKLSE